MPRGYLFTTCVSPAEVLPASLELPLKTAVRVCEPCARVLEENVAGWALSVSTVPMVVVLEGDASANGSAVRKSEGGRQFGTEEHAQPRDRDDFLNECSHALRCRNRPKTHTREKYFRRA